MLYETQVKLHKVFAIGAFLLGVTHGVGHLIEYEEIEAFKLVSGSVLLGMVFLLVFTGCFFGVFNRFFNCFMLMHKIFFFFAIIAAAFHEAYFVFYCGIFWSWFDILLRFIIVRRNSKFLTNSDRKVIQNKFTVLTFDKSPDFTFKEGQFCWLYIPSISLVHFHPFSICSSNNETKIQFIIKKYNNFTKKLLEKVKKNEKFKIFVDGPYGNTTVDIWDKKQQDIILIAGGIGLTPILSLTKFYLNRLKENKIKKVVLYWVTRDLSLLSKIRDLLKIYDDENKFRIHCFFTGEEEKKDLNKNQDLEIDQNLEMEENYEKLVSEKKLRSEQNLEKLKSNKNLEYYKIGRPKWREEFRLIRNYAIISNVKKIGVFVCGPRSMKNDVCGYSRTFSDWKLKFDYNFEEYNPLYIL